jgi:hypothetical protein
MVCINSVDITVSASVPFPYSDFVNNTISKLLPDSLQTYHGAISHIYVGCVVEECHQIYCFHTSPSLSTLCSVQC